ncbi:hypothetical protein KUTeg_008387 [Tegillarca granosa]|uniref:Secreted protein n=1 Tax=Tegillarca granosa TaxID=220873 RepID=A0ABQ9FC79_TEGGR|nr:hypothetical protein KUTeg_008387 [Tegillarca granosa]
MLITYIIIVSLFHLSQGQYSSWYHGCFEYIKQPVCNSIFLYDHQHLNYSTDHSNCFHVNTTSSSTDNNENASYNTMVVKCCELCHVKK